MNKYLLSIFCIIFFIYGCSVSKNIDKNFTKIKNSNFVKKESKSIFLNLDTFLDKIILNMLNCNNIFISNNTLLFVNLLKNSTNLVIDKAKFTNLIKNKISKNTNKISFLGKEVIKKNQEKIGIFNTHNILDISTAILLSRNNHVKYYLYSHISKKNKSFVLTIQLTLVKTGEIVFTETEKLY